MIRVAATQLARGITPPPDGAIWESVDPDVLESLSERITSLSALVHAQTHRLLTLIAEFDRLEGWKREGFSSCADWLAYRTRLDKMTAREKVRVARALTALPETSEAMAKGELSFSQVRALTRVADAGSEGELLAEARSTSAAGLERLCRSWKRIGREDEAATARRCHESRCFSVFPDEEGMYLVRGRLAPEVGALLMRAIEAASDAQYRGSVPGRTPEQRRADAMALLAERVLAVGFEGGAEDDNSAAPHRGTDEPVADEPDADGSAHAARGTASERYLVVLHVDEKVLECDVAKGVGRSDAERSEAERSDAERCHLEDGTRVSAETSKRIACDASVVRMGPAARGSAPPVAGKTRTVPPRMRRALELRDRGCRFPGCGSRFTDAHHIRHWADGGPTRLDNLVLLCRTHHRLLHEGGFRVEADARRPERPVFYGPRNARIPEVPPPMKLSGRSVGNLRLAEDGGPQLPREWEKDAPLALYLRAVGSIG